MQRTPKPERTARSPLAELRRRQRRLHELERFGASSPELERARLEFEAGIPAAIEELRLTGQGSREFVLNLLRGSRTKP